MPINNESATLLVKITIKITLRGTIRLDADNPTIIKSFKLILKFQLKETINIHKILC
ncbi:hypothetical protein HMPREF1430_01243 [Helicobacter pylori GAM96Ai]|nr:hypothetical protein HMPREF1430_01243 [Helicobacter pylori GAM96Ai]